MKEKCKSECWKVFLDMTFHDFKELLDGIIFGIIHKMAPLLRIGLVIRSKISFLQAKNIASFKLAF